MYAFGSHQPPACFQRALHLILKRIKFKTFLVYLDDVIIFSDNVDDQMRHIDEMLAMLTDAEITLKMNKCHLFN